jgi:Rhodopirellula transposase DDE domain
VPYVVYDLTYNVGWVGVGTDHDTASFAVNAIRRWWTTMGKERHPKATREHAPGEALCQRTIPSRVNLSRGLLRRRRRETLRM